MISVATLGSHCALQLLKGAKDEGLDTLLICEKKRESLYRRFKFIDELVLVDTFSEILEQKCESILQKNNSVLIPHGTLIAQMDSKQIESIKTPIFGNKHILRWESDRVLKEQLMKEAKLETPKSIPNPKEINKLVIAKRHGAAGGKGYFLASNEKEYNEKRDQLIKEGIINGDSDLYLQEYTSGVLAYLQFFYSPLKQTILTMQEFSKDNDDVEFTIPEISDTIPQYTYSDLLEKIQATGAKSQWGDDLYPVQLNKIGITGFYFIKDWPVGPKPFYVKVSNDNPKISESFDLMYGDLELSSGSTRIAKKSELEDRMKNKGMKIDTFGYHLGVFDYGVPPHAGCGIGLERLMMALTGIENIRDTTFYPRDVDRLTP